MSPKDVVWGGPSALCVVTHQRGEKSALSSCFLREVFCFVLTGVLRFLDNVTDLLPLTGSEGFPFWPHHPLSSQGCGQKNQTSSPWG